MIKLDINGLKQIWSYLTKKVGEHDENGKYLVIIELNPNENEQAIFDTINTAGVRLTCADTIKNSLFQKYIELLNDEKDKGNAENKAFELYRNKWEKIFSNSSEDVKYWNKTRQIGRLNRDNIEILLHCIAVIKQFYDPAQNTMSDLPKYYKDYINKLNCKEIENFIDEISIFAELYRNNLEEFHSDTHYKYDENEYIMRLMHITDVLDISTFLPYILYLLKEQEKFKNDEYIKNKFLELERYLILNAICELSTQNYNNECVSFIKDSTVLSLKLSNNIQQYKSKFEQSIRNLKRKNKIATLLLFWIELYKRNKAKTDIKSLTYSFTLEHIMPQKWQEHWNIDLLPVFDKFGKPITDENDAYWFREEHVYEIGNMTLLNSKLNSSLSNRDFKTKVNGTNRTKYCMKNCADCLVTREILDVPYWNEAMIRNRTKEFSDIIKEIWKLFI